MQGLILLGWLSAAAVAAEPVTIEVPTHTLANREHSKGATPARSLLERSQHAMSARLRADGISAAVFRETLTNGVWTPASVSPDTNVALENAILSKARELRLSGIQ